MIKHIILYIYIGSFFINYTSNFYHLLIIFIIGLRNICKNNYVCYELERIETINKNVL